MKWRKYLPMTVLCAWLAIPSAAHAQSYEGIDLYPMPVAVQSFGWFGTGRLPGANSRLCRRRPECGSARFRAVLGTAPTGTESI